MKSERLQKLAARYAAFIEFINDFDAVEAAVEEARGSAASVWLDIRDGQCRVRFNSEFDEYHPFPYGALRIPVEPLQEAVRSLRKAFRYHEKWELVRDRLDREEAAKRKQAGRYYCHVQGEGRGDYPWNEYRDESDGEPSDFIPKMIEWYDKYFPEWAPHTVGVHDAKTNINHAHVGRG